MMRQAASQPVLLRRHRRRCRQRPASAARALLLHHPLRRRPCVRRPQQQLELLPCLQTYLKPSSIPLPLFLPPPLFPTMRSMRLRLSSKRPSCLLALVGLISSTGRLIHWASFHQPAGIVHAQRATALSRCEADGAALSIAAADQAAAFRPLGGTHEGAPLVRSPSAVGRWTAAPYFSVYDRAFLTSPPWRGMLPGGRAPAQATQRGGHDHSAPP